MTNDLVIETKARRWPKALNVAERTATRYDVFAKQAESLKREAEALGELEPGDIQRYGSQVASFRRNAARLRAKAAQARRPTTPTTAPRPMARRREPRRQSVRSGPRRARAPGRLADDEPEPVARLGGFLAASARMIQHLERRRAKAAVA